MSPRAADVSTTITIELEVEVEGRASYTPARIGRDPDDSCPAEGEVEIRRATCHGYDLTGLVRDHYADDAEEALAEELVENGGDDGEDEDNGRDR